MRSRSRWGLAVPGGLAVLLAIAGCSHDTLKTNAVGLTVRYVPSPTGSGRYDNGSLNISNIHFVPADPVRAGLLKGDTYTLGVSVSALVTGTQPIALTHVALTPGTYTVTQIDFAPPNLADNSPPAVPAICIENFAAVPTPQFVAQGTMPAEVGLDQSSGLQFVVTAGQQNLDIVVNVPAMISGYESSFTCETAASCGSDSPPCISSFDESAFKTVLLNTVTLH